MPGAGKQPLEVQSKIRELLEAGFDPTTIHRRLKVGRSSIYRMKRSLQQHGTAYMPVELNKKNGRPKALMPDQELEVRDWLTVPENRTRFLDDLVWLIHNRFGIVCSTTTMSKLKRKWLAVIEAEETGRPLDEHTRVLLLETHPDMPILHQQSNAQIPAAFRNPSSTPMNEDRGPDSSVYNSSNLGSNGDTAAAAAAALSMQQRARAADAQIDARLMETHHHDHLQLEPAIDQQWQAQLQREIGRREITAVAPAESLEA